MAFRGVIRQFLGGDVDVHRGVRSRRALFPDVLEFGLVILAEQDVVEAQFGVMSSDAPIKDDAGRGAFLTCLLYTSPSPRDATLSRMPSSA